jgi:hypothetical protein
MEIQVRWRDETGKLQPFDYQSVAHMPRTHMLNLALNPIPLVAHEDGTFITNNAAEYDRYKSAGKKVMWFKDCAPSDKDLQDVGFLS